LWFAEAQTWAEKTALSPQIFKIKTGDSGTPWPIIGAGGLGVSKNSHAVLGASSP
jgi:hypothetical protein